MTDSFKAQPFRPDGITAPLYCVPFRRIWMASLLSNLGALIRGVGAASADDTDDVVGQ